MAADLNHVVLIGRLTRDAELKYTANGQPVCKFAIAVNRRKKVEDKWEEEASFFDIVLWGRQGEALTQYLVKGKMVGVDGELRQDRWVQDGQNRSKVEIVAVNVQLLSGGGGGGAPSSYGQGPSNQGGGRSGGDDKGFSPPDDSAGNDDFANDIPF
jgi:single-strand DNA-binding protein